MELFFQRRGSSPDLRFAGWKGGCAGKALGLGLGLEPRLDLTLSSPETLACQSCGCCSSMYVSEGQFQQSHFLV